MTPANKAPQDYLTPEFIETQRSKGISNSVLGDFIGRNLPEIQAELQTVRQKYGKDNDKAISAYLDWKAYGTTNPQERFALQAEQESFSNPFNPFSQENQVPQKSLGDLGRSVLPATGSIVGGAVGGVLGAPAGPLGIAAGLVGGAAAGRTIGQVGADAISGLEGEQQTNEQMAQSLTGAAKLGAIEGSIDVATLGTLKAGKALLSPFKSQIDNVAVKLFEKYGINAPVSAVSKSEAVRQGEALAAKGLTGSPVQKVIQNAQQELSTVGDNLLSKMKSANDLTVAGKEILEGTKSYESAWRAAKNKLYNEASAKVSSRASTLPREFINVDATKGALDQILSTKTGAKELLGDFVDSNRLQTIRTNLDKKLSIKTLSDALDEINKMVPFGSSIDTGDVAALKKVAATLSKDLDTHIRLVDPDISTALSAADDFYGQGIGILNSQVGTTIRRLADSPEKIANAVIKSSSPSDARRVIELIGSTEGGAQRINEVRGAVMKDILDSSKNPEGVILGKTLMNKITKMGTTLDELYGPELSQGIRDLAQMAVKMDVGQSAARGSQTAFLTKLGALMTALGTGNLPIAAGIAAQDVAFSKIFSSALGKKFLTTGLGEIPAGVSKAGAGAVMAVPRIVNQPDQE